MKAFIALAALIISCSAAARELPRWETLEFEQQAFWVTAHASLHLMPSASESGHWQLTAISSVANNREQLAVEFEPGNGRVVERERLSRGKNQRLKQYFYSDTQFTRVRREPQGDNAQSSGDWAITSKRDIQFPRSIQNHTVIDGYTLLILAADALLEGQGTASFTVHTDFNFYRVQASAGAYHPLVLSKTLEGGNTRLEGERQTRAVTLNAVALPDNPDKPDFSLLGLSGDITIFYDIETGLPLQLRGRAPRIGKTELNLVKVQLRASAP